LGIYGGYDDILLCTLPTVFYLSEQAPLSISYSSLLFKPSCIPSYFSSFRIELRTGPLLIPIISLKVLLYSFQLLTLIKSSAIVLDMILKVTAHQVGSFPTTPCISSSIELAIDHFFTLPSTQVCNLSAPCKLVDTIWLMADWAVPLTEHKQIKANLVHLGHKMGTIYKIWTNTINYNLNHCAGHLHLTILQCFHQK